MKKLGVLLLVQVTDSHIKLFVKGDLYVRVHENEVKKTFFLCSLVCAQEGFNQFIVFLLPI